MIYKLLRFTVALFSYDLLQIDNFNTENPQNRVGKIGLSFRVVSGKKTRYSTILQQNETIC